MSQKRKKEKNTPIKKHKKTGQKLSTEFGAYESVRPVIWDKELLPEFLWIDALAQAYNNDRIWWKIFTQFMDTIDSYVGEATLIKGTISFGVNEKNR
jgi:hypothetical protein